MAGIIRIRRRKRDVVQGFAALKNSRWLPVAAIAWLIVVSLYFLWEAAGYHGLTAYLAEWEYTALRQYYPMLTMAGLIVLIGSPAIWLLSRARRRRRLNARDEGVLDFAVASERALLRVMFVGANVAMLMAAVMLVWTVFLPSAKGPVQRVDVASNLVPAEGAVILSGTPVYGRIASYDQNALALHKVIRFAPMIVPADRSASVRYFVEIAPDRIMRLRKRADGAPYIGILKHGALPGPIQHLFRYAGYTIGHPHFVLYASRLSMCWPYYIFAFNCFFAACLLFVLGLFQRRRVRRAQARVVQYTA